MAGNRTGIPFKLYGLDLAHRHQSAVAQARAEKVYEAIKKSQDIRPGVPYQVKVDHAASAIRLALDRVRRLGERYHENKHVSRRDHLLMEKEFKYLRHEIVRAYESMAPSVQLDGESIGRLPTLEASGMARLVDTVFAGDVKVDDVLTRSGRLADQDADPSRIGLGGIVQLAKNIVTDGPDAVAIAVHTLTAPGRSPDEPALLNEAISVVTDAVMRDPLAMVRSHGHLNAVKNASLVFGKLR